MIRQIHLDECDSTQDVLKEQLSLSSSELILVSCENQISGRGRGENKWTTLPGSLCFSLNFAPHPIISFTAIEIAVILTDFFREKKIDLKLKWPNDLWDKGLKKCGGILVQGTQQQFLAGIGLNLFSNHENFGGIYDTDQRFNKKNLSLEITQYLHSNRIQSSKVLKDKWVSRCGHLNQIVKINEDQEVLGGVFIGLGDFGEAIVQNAAGIHRIFNGSLRLA
jgi:BirA family transcriptional regulator, biotin operon repressor / biotin---[acetyl-CoA-carboxylase] ligase